MYALGLLMLTLMAALPLLAYQAPYIRFDAATGPVQRYEARVRTLTEEVRYLSDGQTPVIEIPALPPEPFWIDVRGCAGTVCGDWSDLHWNTMDLDASGSVGLSDFPLLIESWGFYGLRGFTEMLSHWGETTQANAEGLRWYAD